MSIQSCHIIPIILTLLCNCSSSPKDEFVNAFKDTPVIKLESEQIELKHSKPYLSYLFEMVYSDSLLFVNEFPDPNFCMKIIDLRTKSVRSFAKKGKGPNEMQTQACDFLTDQTNRNLMVSDHRRYYVYPIDSLLDGHDSPSSVLSFPKEKISFLKTTYCNGYFIGNAIENRFAFYDTKTKNCQGKYPYRSGPLVEQSTFYPHPSKSRVAFFQSKSATMGFLDVENNDMALKELCFWESKNKEVLSDKIRYLAPEKGARNGFITASVSEKYIYVLYSGKTFDYRSTENLTKAFLSKYVYAFSWDGKPIKRYQLDQEVRSIAIDEKGNTLYAASYTGGEPHIVKYQLKQ